MSSLSRLGTKLFRLAPLVIAACAEVRPEEEDTIDAELGDGKADGLAWSGAELAGAVRAANELTLAELDNDVGLTTRAAKAIVAARPLRGIKALDAVSYVGPTAIGKLAGFATDLGWSDVAMQKVPAGTFTMGDPDDFRFEPLHDVTLSTYWIDRTEVTNAQWAECVAAGVCRPVDLDQYFGAGYTALPDHPVGAVQWYQADAYCAWRGKTLPTEAQWEKAARGTTDLRVHPWGDAAVTCDRAFVDSCRMGARRPLAVGSRPLGVSVYGVEDMNGNVSEFVADAYDTDVIPTCAEPCVDPPPAARTSAQFDYHSVRGASLFSIPAIAGLEIQTRWGHWWRMDIGFRCALQ